MGERLRCTANTTADLIEGVVTAEYPICLVSDVFVRRGEQLWTAPLAQGVLPGVTRAHMLRLAQPLLSVHERAFTVDELLSADEVFLTASTIELVPVVRIGRRRITDGRPGWLGRTLGQRYRQLIARRLGLDPEQLGV